MSQRTRVSAEAQTITVHIPLTFRKRGGRKVVVTPDGAEWAPRPRVDRTLAAFSAGQSVANFAKAFFVLTAIGR